MGIIQPEANVDVNIFKNVYKNFKPIADVWTGIPKYPPVMNMPDIRFNVGRLLTRAEAVDMITKIFDESKRVVFDELTFKNDTIDDYGYNYKFKKARGYEPDGLYCVLYYHTGKTITYRIDELWQLLYCKYRLTTEKRLVLLSSEDSVGIVFNRRYGAIGTTAAQISLYDGTY